MIFAILLKVIVMYNSTHIERLLFTPEKRVLVRLTDDLVLSFFISAFVFMLKPPFGNEDISNLPSNELIATFLVYFILFYIVILFVSTLIKMLNITLSAHYIIDPKSNQKLYIIKRINKEQVLLSEFYHAFINRDPEFYLFLKYEDVVIEKIQIEKLKIRDNFVITRKNIKNSSSI